jgi:hypothetical protein
MLNSTDFITNLKKHRGIAKANKFQLWQIGGKVHDEIIKKNNQKSSKNIYKNIEDFRYYCEAANFPGRNLATQGFRTGSITKEYIHSNNFNETLNLTFNLTDDMFIKHYFDDWQEMIFPLVETNGPLTNNIKVYPEDYCADVTIKKLSNQGEYRDYTIMLKEAFPKQVNPINLSFASNEPMKLQVVLTYSRWTKL